MTLDFQNQELQGRSLRGQNLVGACFARADIRGVDFGGANLAGADFHQAQAGVGRRWSIGYWVAAAFVAVVVGLIVGSAGSRSHDYHRGATALAVGSQVVVSAFAVLRSLLCWRFCSDEAWVPAYGPGRVSGGRGSPAADCAQGSDCDFLLLLVGFGGLLAGSVLLATVFAVLRSSAGGRWAVAPLLLAVLVAAPGRVGDDPRFRNSTRASGITVPALLIAGLVTLIFFPMGVYLAPGHRRRLPLCSGASRHHRSLGLGQHQL